MTRRDEARHLLRYVTKASGEAWEPSEKECDRYRALLEAHGFGAAPPVPATFLRHALLLGSLDAASRLVHPESPLQCKLRAAAVIVECSPGSAAWLLPRDRSPMSLMLELTRLLGRIMGKFLVAFALVARPKMLRRYAGL